MTSEDPEHYGKHSRAHARGATVVELLRRVVMRGEAIRLAWHGDEATNVTNRSEDFPTAVLPAIRDDFPDTDDEETEPTTATREVRKWLLPERFAWWPQTLVG